MPGIPLDRGTAKRTATVAVWSPTAQRVELTVYGDTERVMARTVAPKVLSTWLLRAAGVPVTVRAVCAADCAVSVTVWNGNDPLLAMPAIRCR